MKCSESWLREWVNPNLTLQALSQILTMGGFEVEEILPAAETFTGVVIGQILKAEKIPLHTHLFLCEVDIGKKKPLQIVCGAEHIKQGMKIPVALSNAKLPNDISIKNTSIHGVTSEGMLCSAPELGLGEESNELFVLPPDAPLGQDLWHYLGLKDNTIDISITPNRGDCLSVRGLAREVSALTRAPLKKITIPKIKPTLKDKFPVKIQATAACPHYVGRIIRHVKADSTTPAWLTERLRRSGLRSINPIVDVTNYVMLELGQPLHAFDLNTLAKSIIIREAKKGESITLLDGSKKTLNAHTLIIADQQKPLAIAGVMGGLDSSVTSLTQDIFLESAFFLPQIIARQRQYYGLNSDSAYRFERGVDWAMQREAIERSTQLILEIVGGEAGPLIEETSQKNLPQQSKVKLIKNKLNNVLGLSLSVREINSIFDRLKFSYKFAKNNEWKVTPPSFRFDISLPEDLIEEVARLHGYDKIPTAHLAYAVQANKTDETEQNEYKLRQILSDQGYHEIITYSFIDKKLQSLLDPQEVPRELVNPITTDMTVMRTNLWAGLVNTLLYNKSRQQQRIRIFEIGNCFVERDNKILEQQRVGGLVTGLVHPEQWGFFSREIDFFDLKGDIQKTLAFMGYHEDIHYRTDVHPALHPAQSAGIFYRDKKVGMLGALHPSVLEALDLSGKVFVFELDFHLMPNKLLRRFQTLSKFPEIRRDIAIVVNQAIPAKEIQDTIRKTAGDWLKEIFIFDVYQGKGISPGFKSIALALVLQHPTRTLIDDEVAELMECVIKALKGQLGAELRS